MNDMNVAHLHLLLNHLPVLGPIFGLALLLLGLWRESEPFKRVALGVLLVAALLAVPVYLTGEPAEDAVQMLPGVSKAITEKHEEVAVVAFTAMVALGAIALGGLIRYRGSRAVAPWFATVLLAATLLTSALMAWTAGLGGQVRHTEIRPASAPMGGTFKSPHH